MAIVKFKDSKVNFQNLLAFGFVKQGTKYQFQTPIVEQQFILKITVSADGSLETHVFDSETQDEYVLHLQAGVSGKFVALVAAEYQAVLKKIQDSCYDSDVFKAPQAKAVIKHMKVTYDNQLEFLWKKLPHYAVLRRSDTNKWYGILFIISKSKLGIASEGEVTVIDLRATPEEITRIVDNKIYFRGYHMSKKTWYSIILDNSVKDSEIFERMQTSYELAK